MSASDVIDHHLQSFGRRDLDGILSDYEPRAVLFTPDGPLRGPEAMRPLYAALLAEFGEPGARFELQARHVDGDYGYIVWSGETARQRYDLATDTFVVRNGRIVVQTFAAQIVGKPVPIAEEGTAAA